MAKPLQYRRNAISINVDRSDLASKLEQKKSFETENAAQNNTLQVKDQGRMMSISEETSDPRLRRILSRISPNIESQKEEESSILTRLTDAQVNAFKEVFDLFDSNGGGTIDADELDLALQSVGIKLSSEDLAGVLETMDKDGNGEIDFEEFLNLMTNTEKFLESFEPDKDDELKEEKRRREIMLFDALTQFMKNSALHSMEEIVGFFSSKYKRSQAPHVVSHYAAGARLIGLTEKQLEKHMERIRATNANSNSPYAQPLYNLKTSSNRKRSRLTSSPLATGSKTKKGKIRLKFMIDSSKKTSTECEGKQDNRVRGVKSASELHGPRSSDTVTKKPRQVNIKKNGWVSEKAKPLSVRLPTVHLKIRKHRPDKPRRTLTVDDLPEIRKKVGKVKENYYKQVRLKKTAEAEQHWQSLEAESITSDVLKTRFRKVFRAYTAVW